MALQWLRLTGGLDSLTGPPETDGEEQVVTLA